MLSINNSVYSNSNIQSPKFKRHDGYNYSSSSTTKKCAIGASSFFIPGLGQVINGETSKGVAFVLGIICCHLLPLIRRNPKAMTLGSLAHLGTSCWAAYDAYKNA